MEVKIKETEAEIADRLDKIPDTLKEDGYPDVQIFMRTFREMESVVEQYNRDLAEWEYQISRKPTAAAKEQLRPPEKQSVLKHLGEIQERNKQISCTSDNTEGNFLVRYFPVSLFGFYCHRQGKASIVFCSKLFPPNYFAFCFFKTIPHTTTAAKKIKIRYHRFSNQNPLSNINRYPQEAGKISPIVSKKSGRNSMGNIIPESIIEGKNTNCAIIVSFA